jgi:hypothetical protein
MRKASRNAFRPYRAVGYSCTEASVVRRPPRFDAKRKLLAMRTIPIFLISLGLFLTGCTLEPEKRPDLHAEICTEACVTNPDCKDNPAGPICVDGACAACTKDTECDPGLKCNGGSCTECITDKDCKGNPNGLRCDDTGTCNCSTNADCTADHLHLCRYEGCVCSDNTACAGQGPEICRNGACLACSTDEHCAALAADDPSVPPHCDVESGQCTACAKDEHCGTAGEVCIGAGTPSAACGCDEQTKCGAHMKCFNPGKAGAVCGCTDDTGCAGDPANPICNKEAGVCVPCWNDPAGNHSKDVKCKEAGFKCFGPGASGIFCGCTSDKQCADDPDGNIACDTLNGVCRACVTDQHCAKEHGDSKLKLGSICLPDGTCSCKSDGECGGIHTPGLESSEWVCE